ncbi:hypothetical protein ID866_6512 [Astraeus odoratus]|nr:hypothetical protein ID866_6512 [Astraeus odoratus]
MCSSTYLFGFVLLAFFIVDVLSAAHLSIPEIPPAPVLVPDRARALYRNQLGKRDGTVSVEKQGQYYLTNIITSSGSTFKLVVDTGSSYTWVGAMEDNPYVRGRNSKETSQTVDIEYAHGTIQLHATTWLDLIVLDGLYINPQEIGVPSSLDSFPAGIDGILGLGPTRLNDGITSDRRINPTVVDNLYSQGSISYPVFGIYLVPTNVRNVGGGGLLSFGNIDVTVLTGDVKYAPVTQISLASDYWGVDASFAYGNKPILGPASGVLDTGTVGICLIDDAFVDYRVATGAAIDFFDASKRLTITQDQYNGLQPLSILVGDQSYDLSPNAQIFARDSHNEQIFLVVRRIDPGSGLDFILGSAFFERYYVVFNSSNSQIGFASHMHTDSTTN